MLFKSKFTSKQGQEGEWTRGEHLGRKSHGRRSAYGSWPLASTEVQLICSQAWGWVSPQPRGSAMLFPGSPCWGSGSLKTGCGCQEQGGVRWAGPCPTGWLGRIQGHGGQVSATHPSREVPGEGSQDRNKGVGFPGRSQNYCHTPVDTLWTSVNLKKKTVNYLTSKMGLFGKGKELQFGRSKLWQNHKQVERTKNAVSQKKGESWGNVLNKRSIGGNWESHITWLLIGWVVKASHWLSCEASHWLSCCWGRRKTSLTPSE